MGEGNNMMTNFTTQAIKKEFHQMMIEKFPTIKIIKRFESKWIPGMGDKRWEFKNIIYQISGVSGYRSREMTITISRVSSTKVIDWFRTV